MTNIGSIVFDIIANTSSLDKMAAVAQKQFVAMEKQALRSGAVVDKVTKQMGKSFDHVEKEVKETGVAADKAAKKIDKSFEKVEKEVTEAAVTVDKSTKKMREDFKATGDSSKVFSQKLAGVGRGMMRNVSLPIAAFGALSVKAFADFDKSMTNSLSIIDASPEQIGRMEDTAIQVSKTTKFAAKEAADAYFFLGSAGMNAEQSIAALPTVAEFAQAGMFDLATATDLATDAQTALGLNSKDPIENLKQLNRVTDVLVGANVQANATVKQFSEALTNDAATASRTFGKDLEETVAVLAAYANQGIKGAEAGTMYGRALRLLDKAARDEAKAFEAAGIAVNDADDNMRNMADIVQDLTAYLGDMTTAERGAALETLGFAALSQKAITPLLGMSDSIREIETSLDDAFGTRAKVAAKQAESFSAGINRAKNNVIALAMSIGETLAPAITSLANFIGGLSDAFSRLTEVERGVIIGLAAIAAAAGPIMLIVAKLMVWIPALAAGFSALGIGLLPFIGILAAAAAAGVALGIAISEIVDEMSGLETQTQEMSFGEKIQDWILQFRILVNEVKFGIKLFMELGQNFFAEQFTNIKRLMDLVTGKMSIGEFLESQTVGMVDSFKQVFEANRAARDAGEEKIMNSVVDKIAGKIGEADKTMMAAGGAAIAGQAVDVMAGLDEQIASDMLDLEADFNKQLMNMPMKKKKRQATVAPKGITEPFAKAIEDGTIAAYKLRNEIGTQQGPEAIQKDQLKVQKKQLEEQKKQENYLRTISDDVKSIDRSMMGLKVGAFA